MAKFSKSVATSNFEAAKIYLPYHIFARETTTKAASESATYKGGSPGFYTRDER